MLWFNFILGLNYFYLLIILHYHTPKQRKIEFKHIHYTPTTGKFSKE